MSTVHLGQGLRREAGSGPPPAGLKRCWRKPARKSRRWVSHRLSDFLSSSCRKGVGDRKTKSARAPPLSRAAPLRRAPPASGPPRVQRRRRGGSARRTPGAGLRRLVPSRPPSPPPPPTYCPQELRRRSGERRGEEMGEQSGAGSPRGRAGTGSGWPAPEGSPTRAGPRRGAGEGRGRRGTPPPRRRAERGASVGGTGPLNEGGCTGLGFGEHRLPRARRGGGTPVLGAELRAVGELSGLGGLYSGGGGARRRPAVRGAHSRSRLRGRQSCPRFADGFSGLTMVCGRGF